MHRVLGQEYDDLLVAWKGDQIELVRLSRGKFDLDHAAVGGMLGDHWGLPPLLVEPIRYHHDLGSGTKRSRLTESVYGGVLCGQVFAAEGLNLLERAKERV